MNIAMIQVSTLLGEPQKNRTLMEPYIQLAIQQGADVLVLPETWNVGFFPKNIHELAKEAEQDDSLAWLQKIAQTYKVNVVGGSIAMKEQDKVYNRCYVFNREGAQVYSYDKIHLFSPGSETNYFEQGKSNQIFELDGIPCAVQICYDLRFPELARGLALQGAKILFTPAQWPHPRSEHWLTLNRARAIENQLYVVAVNGCGEANGVHSCGHSVMYDPFGEVLVLADEEQGVYISPVFEEKVDHVRQQIPVFVDRKPNLYREIESKNITSE
ncbi:carbon-nitrogen family hydrolase [Bacillus horti]|uniref:Amidohydrolase n=1 Tax=Caldalkalibacillus horti TaxID=77523 RepID=A0ABT9VX41_9BACI|nr:carbon-nitrogen family hydrolase [Bacillus horti]MDQ0165180.1 putative amidohydrolase [Bacillus horti]